MKLIGIVARSRNNVIGNGKKIPWHLADDMKHFKTVTEGQKVIMGMSTYVSLGKPLKRRFNIVLTRDPSINRVYEIKSKSTLIYINDINELNGFIPDTSIVYIIGGSEIFKLFENQIDEYYVSEVDAEIEGDVFFNNDLSLFHSTLLKEYPKNGKNDFAFKVVHYKR